MTKIKLDYAKKSYKNDNYSTKVHKDTASDFFGLLVIGFVWGAIVVHIIVEITK